MAGTAARSSGTISAASTPPLTPSLSDVHQSPKAHPDVDVGPHKRGHFVGIQEGWTIQDGKFQRTRTLTLGRTKAGTLLAYRKDGTAPASELAETSKTWGAAAVVSDCTPASFAAVGSSSSWMPSALICAWSHTARARRQLLEGRSTLVQGIQARHLGQVGSYLRPKLCASPGRLPFTEKWGVDFPWGDMHLRETRLTRVKMPAAPN